METAQKTATTLKGQSAAHRMAAYIVWSSRRLRSKCFIENVTISMISLVGVKVHLKRFLVIIIHDSFAYHLKYTLEALKIKCGGTNWFVQKEVIFQPVYINGSIFWELKFDKGFDRNKNRMHFFQLMASQFSVWWSNPSLAQWYWGAARLITTRWISQVPIRFAPRVA